MISYVDIISILLVYPKFMAVNIGDAFQTREGQGIASTTGYGSIGDFLTQSIIPNLMLGANIILFFIIVFAGISIIGSAGNPQKQQQASQTLAFAVIGFLLIFGAYWIMQILGIITGASFAFSS
jgi:hypothetical protein